MNEMQKKFFEYLAVIQEDCVQICLNEHKCRDKTIESMLYSVTYEMTTEIMELIDGYSTYSNHRHDLVDTVTGKRLKENPFIELHDQTEGMLRYE